jgi:hypothetical protein
MKPLASLAAGLAAAVFVAGCGASGPRKYEVSGAVKYDGQPVPDGQVIFTPADGSAPEGGPIKDGRYTVSAREGVNKVQVRGSRVVPGKKGPMGEDWVEAFVPDKYNDKTTLTADVGSGKTEHNFDLPK